MPETKELTALDQRRFISGSVGEIRDDERTRR
jgi:hypothetical protein